MVRQKLTDNTIPCPRQNTLEASSTLDTRHEGWSRWMTVKSHTFVSGNRSCHLLSRYPFGGVWFQNRCFKEPGYLYTWSHAFLVSIYKLSVNVNLGTNCLTVYFPGWKKNGKGMVRVEKRREGKCPRWKQDGRRIVRGGWNDGKGIVRFGEKDGGKLSGSGIVRKPIRQ